MEKNNVPTETKTIDDHWRDWLSDAFGFGYGTGEQHIIPPLKRFFELCSEGNGHGYDHEVLEGQLGGTVAWLLISRLCHIGAIDYGTSPRYAWLSERGKLLKEYVSGKTSEELYSLAMGSDEPYKDYIECDPDYCNCGPNSQGMTSELHEKNRKCPNPFWRASR